MGPSLVYKLFHNSDESWRFNYIRWIQDLLDATNGSYSEDVDEENEMVGLDVYDYRVLMKFVKTLTFLKRYRSELHLSTSGL